MKLNPFSSYNLFQHFLFSALALSKNILIVGSGNSALDLCSGIQKARNALNRGCPRVSGNPRGTGVCCLNSEDNAMGGGELLESGENR